MVEVATHAAAQMVVASAVGAVGLVPTYRALEAGKDVALANKETLVMAGELMLARARETGARLLPIDSEHCALHECLEGRRPEDVRRLLLTASGGPFRNRPRESFLGITREEALAHPTWRMGPKITIDSATLMNKGLEVIEAHWLFGVEAAKIEVLIHPQSVVHSMVELVDGTVLAQLGVTDMRMPIQYALSYPEKWPSPIPGMDFAQPLAARLRAARPRALPVPGTRLPGARDRAARPRRRSTPRTRRRWLPFSTGRRRFSPSPRRSRKSSRPSRARPRRRSRTYSRPTPGRGSAPGRPSRGGLPPASTNQAPRYRKRNTWAFSRHPSPSSSCSGSSSSCTSSDT